MTREELNALLTRLQVLDNRQVDRLTADAWWPIVGHLRYDDALEAMHNHFRDNPDIYLKPGHIAVGARSLRDSRTRYDHTRDDRGNAPRPLNLEALSAAWNDPDAWQEQVGAYNQQLRGARMPHYALDADSSENDREYLAAPGPHQDRRGAIAAARPHDITEPRRSIQA